MSARHVQVAEKTQERLQQAIELMSLWQNEVDTVAPRKDQQVFGFFLLQGGPCSLAFQDHS